MIPSVFINQGHCKAREMKINLGNYMKSESSNPKDVTIRMDKEELKGIVKNE